MKGKKNIKTFDELITSIELMLRNVTDYVDDADIRSKAMKRADREFYQACNLSVTAENWQKLQELSKQLSIFKDKGYEFV